MGKSSRPDKISTLLGPEARFEGTLDFQGSVRVDGIVKGKICSSGGTLILGEKARVDARITVGVVIILGQVCGVVEAIDRIEIHSSGRVMGDIIAPVLSIAKGGVLHGRCSMKLRAAAPLTADNAFEGKPALVSRIGER